MSFSEDCVRFGDQLAKLVDAGVPVREAAAALGVSQQRAYAILRAMGRPMGSPNQDVTGVDQAQLAAVFTETGSVNAAAKALEVAHCTARRMLVELGLVDAARQQRGKPQQRARFFELVDSGWTVTQAAREVGVHPITGARWCGRVPGRRDMRADARISVRLTDVGTVPRYTQPVKSTVADGHRVSEQVSASRYLQLADRLAIADGLVAGLSQTAIAEQIGRNKSTVSREVAAHRVAGLYLPYQADAAAAAVRARPKQSKLVSNQKLRQVVTDGLRNRWSPEEISHGLVKITV